VWFNRPLAKLVQGAEDAEIDYFAFAVVRPAKLSSFAAIVPGARRTGWFSFAALSAANEKKSLRSSRLCGEILIEITRSNSTAGS